MALRADSTDWNVRRPAGRQGPTVRTARRSDGVQSASGRGRARWWHSVLHESKSPHFGPRKRNDLETSALLYALRLRLQYMVTWVPGEKKR
jgi:hypothetical protein